MRIITESTKVKIEDKDKFINNVLKRVVLVLKNDPRFTIDEKINKLKVIEKRLKNKDKTLQSLLESSTSFKDNIGKEIEKLKESNDKTRVKLLKKITKA